MCFVDYVCFCTKSVFVCLILIFGAKGFCVYVPRFSVSAAFFDCIVLYYILFYSNSIILFIFAAFIELLCFTWNIYLALVWWWFAVNFTCFTWNIKISVCLMMIRCKFRFFHVKHFKILFFFLCSSIVY